MEDDLEEKFRNALKIMGLEDLEFEDITKEKLKATWKEWVARNHNDRTGDLHLHQTFNEAYQFLTSVLDDDDASFEYVHDDDAEIPEDLYADRIYTHAHVCHLAHTLLQYRCWIIHAKRRTQDLGSKVARWGGVGWIFTYPSWVQDCLIFEQRVTSMDHIRLVRELLAVSPLEILHIRHPQEISVRKKIWVIWRSQGLLNSVALYPVE